MRGGEEDVERRDVQHVKRDLTTDRVGEVVVGKLLLERLDEGGADLVDLERKTHAGSARWHWLSLTLARSRKVKNAAHLIVRLKLVTLLHAMERKKQNVVKRSAAKPKPAPQKGRTKHFVRWG